QPMVYQEGERTYAITYNGEIYNFRELRRELESYGHTFRTRSDTEVLLHAYIEWGEACVRRLNGIFAFGLWDEQKQQLLLARDHLGVKPLFYAQRGSAILFGSELKVLLAHPLVKAEVDADGLAANEFKREGKQLHTYSIDFVESAEHFHSTALHPSLDAPWVKRMSEYLGTQHHTITVDASALVESLLVPLYAHDFPTAGQMTSSLYLLFKAMKQEATVALSGESADEVFGGYPWFHSEAALKAQTFPWLPAFGESATSWVSADLVQKVHPTDHIEQQYRQAIAEVPTLEREDALAARRREMFYLNLTRFLPFLLDRKDRMSMATGFEARVPF